MNIAIFNLEQKLPSSVDYIERIDALNALAWSLRDTDKERALKLSYEAYELARAEVDGRVCYARGQAESLVHLCFLHYRHCDYEQAIQQGLAGIELCESINYLDGAAECYHTLALNYINLGMSVECLEHELKALSLFESTNNKSGQARTLNGIALVYMQLDRHAEANLFVERAIPINRQLGENLSLAVNLVNLSSNYQALGKIDAALETALECMQIAQRIGSKRVEGMALNALIKCYTELGDYAQAAVHAQRALAGQAMFTDMYELVQILQTIAHMYSSQLQYEDAERYLLQALTIAEESRQVECEYACHESLVDIYKHQGKLDKALEHYEKFHWLKENVFNTNADTKLKTLDLLRQTETARKEADWLKLKNRELEQEIAERKRFEFALVEAKKEADEAKERAEAANRGKSEFLSNISHEIRTSMNGVIGMTGFLLDSGLKPEQQEPIEMIRSSGESLLMVINQILDYSAIESGNIELEHQVFDLRKCITDTLHLFVQVANEKGLVVVLGIAPNVPETVVGDASRLRQILVNLLNNAVKFTEHGEVKLLVEAETPYHARHKLHFAVIDTGIGISQEKMDQLFQSFSWVDSSVSHTHRGAGLGLVISKRLSQTMGGDMWVKSEIGQGSTFHFTVGFESVPAKSQQELPPTLMSEQSTIDNDQLPKLTKAQTKQAFLIPSYFKILLAEDNLVNQKVALRFLERIGGCPDIANNGVEAVEAMRQKDYDLILMDIHMPDMDGFEATRVIRSTIDSARQPIIMAMTASALRADQEMAMEAGMDFFISKPIRADELTEWLAMIIGSYTKNEEL